MTVALADIYASFPELDLSVDDVPNTDQDALVNAKLAEATAQVDTSIFQSSTNADSAIKYLTAHLIALSPAGLNMKLAKLGTQDTVYWPTYQRLARAASFGYRVP